MEFSTLTKTGKYYVEKDIGIWAFLLDLIAFTGVGINGWVLSRHNAITGGDTGRDWNSGQVLIFMGVSLGTGWALRKFGGFSYNGQISEY